MLYLGTSPSDAGVRHALDHHTIGLMCQPGSNRPETGWTWAADNGCFSDSWDEWRWWRWLLDDHRPRTGCLFAVCPDVVGDPYATLRLFERYNRLILGAGYPVAFVLQDGAELDVDLIPPFSSFDCLFIGGSTQMKMSEATFDVAQWAREHGKWIHVGRVNSWQRFKAWAPFAHSCDGTMLAHGPSKNLTKLLEWRDRHANAPQMALSGLA